MGKDFSKTLIHASSMGVLFIEPKEAAAKKAGELSATAKTHLVKVYIKEYWGIDIDITTKQMQKGTIAEEDVITLVSRVHKKLYEKNDVQEYNEFAIGHADIVQPDEIIDVKASWSPETFIPKLLEPLDKMYNIQLQTYMWLYNKPKAKLCYGLVNTPDFLIQDELRKLLYKMDVISEESPEYLRAAEKLMKNMVFDDIPLHEKVITIEVPRDEEIIDAMPKKVEKARDFLGKIYEKHLGI